MNEDNTNLVLQIIQANPAIVYIIGGFLAVISALYIANIYKTLFPKRDDKKDDKPQIVVVNTNDSILERYEKLLDTQDELLDSYRESLRQIRDDYLRDKKLDDTIPLRDDMLNTLDKLIGDDKE